MKRKRAYTICKDFTKYFLMIISEHEVFYLQILNCYLGTSPPHSFFLPQIYMLSMMPYGMEQTSGCGVSSKSDTIK